MEVAEVSLRGPNPTTSRVGGDLPHHGVTLCPAQLPTGTLWESLLGSPPPPPPAFLPNGIFFRLGLLGAAGLRQPLTLCPCPQGSWRSHQGSPGSRAGRTIALSPSLVSALSPGPPPCTPGPPPCAPMPPPCTPGLPPAPLPHVPPPRRGARGAGATDAGLQRAAGAGGLRGLYGARGQARGTTGVHRPGGRGGGAVHPPSTSHPQSQCHPLVLSPVEYIRRQQKPRKPPSRKKPERVWPQPEEPCKWGDSGKMGGWQHSGWGGPSPALETQREHHFGAAWSWDGHGDCMRAAGDTIGV